MRALIALILLAAGPSLAQAQTVAGIDILDTGVVSLKDPKTIKDTSISTGTRTQSDATITRSTTTIEVAPDVVFGAKVRVRGQPNGTIARYRVVWKYPEPGLRNPNTGTTKLSDEFMDGQRLGSVKCCYCWKLGEEWTLVPGRWVVEFWDGERLLASQAFTLVKPGRSAQPDTPPPQDSAQSQTNSSEH